MNLFEPIQENNLLVTLGIVVFNTPFDILKECFNSILNSTIKPEVIILCNSNNLVYENEIKKLCKTYNFKYLNSENCGFGISHNKIVQLVKTDWYICCNPDIILQPNTIEVLLCEVNVLVLPGLIGPKVLNYDGTVQKLCRKHLTVFNWIHRQIWNIFPYFSKPYEENFNYEISQKIEFVSGCFFLISTNLYRQLNGFSSEFFLYCEDADFSKRMTNLGNNNYYISSAIVTHKWKKNTTKSFVAFKIHIWALWKYFKIHGFF